MSVVDESALVNPVSSVLRQSWSQVVLQTRWCPGLGRAVVSVRQAVGTGFGCLAGGMPVIRADAAGLVQEARPFSQVIFEGGGAQSEGVPLRQGVCEQASLNKSCFSQSSSSRRRTVSGATATGHRLIPRQFKSSFQSLCASRRRLSIYSICISTVYHSAELMRLLLIYIIITAQGIALAVKDCAVLSICHTGCDPPLPAHYSLVLSISAIIKEEQLQFPVLPAVPRSWWGLWCVSCS